MQGDYGRIVSLSRDGAESFHEATSEEPRGVSGTKRFKATSVATVEGYELAMFTYMSTQDSGLIVFDVQGWLY